MSYDELPAEVGEEEARAYWNAYELLKANEHYEEVNEILDNLCKQYPRVAKFRFNHALVLYNLELIKEAILELDAALELKPNDRKGQNFRKFLVSKLEARGINASKVIAEAKAEAVAKSESAGDEIKESVLEEEEVAGDLKNAADQEDNKVSLGDKTGENSIMANPASDGMEAQPTETMVSEGTKDSKPMENPVQEESIDLIPKPHESEVDKDLARRRLTDLKSLIKTSTNTEVDEGNSQKVELVTFTNMAELEEYKNSISKFNEKLINKKLEEEIVEEAWAPDDIIVIEDEYEFIEEEPIIEVAKKVEHLPESIDEDEHEEFPEEMPTPMDDEKYEDERVLEGEIPQSTGLADEEAPPAEKSTSNETIHDLIKNMKDLGLEVVNIFKSTEPISSILGQYTPNKAYISSINIEEHVNRILEEMVEVTSSESNSNSVYQSAKSDMKNLLGNLKKVELERKFDMAVTNFKKNQFYTVNDPYLLLFMSDRNPVKIYMDADLQGPLKPKIESQGMAGEANDEKSAIVEEMTREIGTLIRSDAIESDEEIEPDKDVPSTNDMAISPPEEQIGEQGQEVEQAPEQKPAKPAPPLLPVTRAQDGRKPKPPAGSRPKTTEAEIEAMIGDITVVQAKGEAYSDYMEQIAFFKENLTKFKRIARQLYNNREYDNALRLYNKLIECLPEDLEILFNTSFCYRELEQFVESISYLKRILEYYYDNAYGWYCLANVYFMVEDRPKELYCLKKAREFGYFVNIDRLSRLAVTYQEQNPFEF